ncbi:MAG: hypothetical protein ABDI20_01525 [Candidatus Bipolaricaulaceae bacterium]
MPQGLDRLVGYFQERLRHWPWEWAKIPAFVRALAIRYEQVVSAESRLEPQGMGAIVVGVVLGKLVDLLLNAIYDYLSGLAEPRFVRAVVKAPFLGIIGGWKVIIDTGDIKDLYTHWDVAWKWLIFGSNAEQYGTPCARALDRDTWPHFFSRWGIELVTNPREASVVIAMVYTYAEIEKRVSYEDFKPYFHNLLRVMEFAYEAMFLEPHRPQGSQWRVLGIGVPSPEEDSVVLLRTRVEESEKRRRLRRDVAVVNVYSGSFVQDGERDDVARVQQWVEQAVKCLKSPEYIDQRPHRDRGLDIAAVVFTRDLSATEGDNVRALADTLREKFPRWRPPAFEHPSTQDTFSRAAFLIWWEQGELWYSPINLGPADITLDLELEVVQGLAMGDHPRKEEPVIRRYDPDTRTSSVVNPRPRAVGNVSNLSQSMVLISAGALLPTSEEAFVPCTASAASGK